MRATTKRIRYRTLAQFCIPQNNHMIDHVCVSKDLWTGCRFHVCHGPWAFKWTYYISIQHTVRKSWMCSSLSFPYIPFSLLNFSSDEPFWSKAKSSISSVLLYPTVAKINQLVRTTRNHKLQKHKFAYLIMKNTTFARFPRALSFVHISQLFSSYQRREMTRLVVWTTWELARFNFFSFHLQTAHV